MYVTACVLEGTKRILPWSMIECSEEHTFASLFEGVRLQLPCGGESCVVKACSLSKTLDCTLKVNVCLGFNVVECCSINGQYVRFTIDSEEERDVTPQRNALLY